MSPLKAKRAPANSALQNFKLWGAYHMMALLTKLFEKPFWFFEQRRGVLQDEIERRRR
jgi:hypothetical protein